MKKIISFLFISFLIVTSAYAQRFDYHYQGIKFRCKINSGMATITSFDQNASKVIIPSVVNYKEKSYSVNKIDTYISGCNYSTISLVIEEGVEEIKNYSFVEFRKLEYVVLPNSLTNIGKNSFANVNDIAYFQAPATICSIINRNKENITNSVWAQNVPTASINAKRPSVQEDQRSQKKSDKQLKRESPKKESISFQQPIVATSEIQSDVDSNIPKSKHSYNNAFVIIIANETYDVESKVDFALRDGRTFKEYCQKTLGIPEENIRLTENATYMQIKRNMDWLRKIAQISNGDCRLFVYYAGHGMPDEKQNCAYLLPTDAYASDIETTGYSLKEMYNQLGAMPAKSITVFLDACFSGMRRNGTPITASRGIAIKPKEETLTGKLVVFSATSENESAYSYESKGHGLFTYYLLKKLKETKGNLSYGELYNYLRKEVGLKSLTLNDKGQTPEVHTAPQLESIWKTIKFNTNL